jgi:hypothetical protein
VSAAEKWATWQAKLDMRPSLSAADRQRATQVLIRLLKARERARERLAAKDMRK